MTPAPAVREKSTKNATILNMVKKVITVTS